MRNVYFVLVFLFTSSELFAQSTFKAGWNTYQTGMVIHEYSYSCSFRDSIRLFLTDSSTIFATSDSMVTVSYNYPVREASVYKTAYFFNGKKQLMKKEEYKDENLQNVNEWKYDDKDRKIYHMEDSKQNGNNYKENYDYSTDKKTGEVVATESSYFNGKIRFYTKCYFDKKMVKYKEVRLNDNNKDIIHVESYTYGENGKVKGRSVYFPEFKVTKKFEEKEGSALPKCFRTLPMGTAEKVNLHTRVSFMKKLMTRVDPILSDRECSDFEYKFTNGTNCEIIIATTNMNNTKRVVFRYKERV